MFLTGEFLDADLSVSEVTAEGFKEVSSKSLALKGLMKGFSKSVNKCRPLDHLKSWRHRAVARLCEGGWSVLA